jgi:hypothetical protein
MFCLLAFIMVLLVRAEDKHNPGQYSDEHKEAKMSDVLRHVFDPMDMDMDGKLTPEEFVKFIHMSAPVDTEIDEESVWAQHMGPVDSDHDGVVSREEFLVDFKAKHGGEEMNHLHFGGDLPDGMLHEDMMQNAPSLKEDKGGVPVPEMEPPAVMATGEAKKGDDSGSHQEL